MPTSQLNSPYRSTDSQFLTQDNTRNGITVDTRQSGQISFGSGFSLHDRAGNTSSAGTGFRKGGASVTGIRPKRRGALGVGSRKGKFGFRSVAGGSRIVGSRIGGSAGRGETATDVSADVMGNLTGEAGRYAVRKTGKYGWKATKGGAQLTTKGAEVAANVRKGAASIAAKAASRAEARAARKASASLTGRIGSRVTGVGLKAAALSSRLVAAVATVISAVVSTVTSIITTLPVIIVVVLVAVLVSTIISFFLPIFGVVGTSSAACAPAISDTATAAPSASPSVSPAASDSASPSASPDSSATAKEEDEELPLGGCILPPDTLPVNASYPPEGASVKDPTTSGLITPRMYRLYQKLQSMPELIGHGKAMGCWRPRDPYPDHPSGHACDLMYAYGKFPTGKELADGNRTATWMTQHAEEYGIRYLIWQGRIWTSGTGKWRKYSASAYSDEDTNPTTGHYDHIHVTVW